MSWVRIDDRYPWHPKLAAAGPTMRAFAIALDVAGLCYSAQHATDGFLPEAIISDLFALLPRGKGRPTRDILVRVGRWERDTERGGYVIHGFHDFNPTAAERQARQEQAAKRTQKWRKRRSGDASHQQERDASVTRRQGDTRDAAPHPRPAEGGDGDPPKSPHPRTPSGPASPTSAIASGDADSAGQTRSPPGLTSTNPDPGDLPGRPGQPNGQPPSAEAKARLNEAFGPNWRRGLRQQATETQAEFEAKRERFRAELDAYFAQNPVTNDPAVTDP